MWQVQERDQQQGRFQAQHQNLPVQRRPLRHPLPARDRLGTVHNEHSRPQPGLSDANAEEGKGEAQQADPRQLTAPQWDCQGAERAGSGQRSTGWIQCGPECAGVDFWEEEDFDWWLAE